MNKEFYTSNRERTFNLLPKGSISVFFSGKAKQRTNDEFYKFTVNKNFYYLTGLDKQNMILALFKGKESHAFLFIEENNEFYETWLGKRMTKEEASENTGIPVSQIKYINDFHSLISYALTASRVDVNDYQFLYIDLLRFAGLEVNTMEHNFAKEARDKYPELQIKNSQKILSELRMYKSPEEIKEMEGAIEITNRGIQAIMKNASPGLYEYQIESFYKQSLAFDNSVESFKTIMAGGLNATIYHYEDNNTVVNDGDMVLFDLGAVNNWYSSDISRTIPVNGKFSDRQKVLYQIVLDVNKAAIKEVKPGITMGELNEFAKNMIAERLIEIGLITDAKDVGKYYAHVISHHIGLDVHDTALNSRKLEKGMVITVEPGIYIKEENIGIRIEDDVLVTKNGSKNLSKNIIKEIDDIEQMMKKI